MNSREPVLTANSVTGVILAVLGLLGVTLSEANVGNLGVVVAFVVPLVVPIIAGYIARQKVTPVSDVSDFNRRR